jgi:hypothetical protein
MISRYQVGSPVFFKGTSPTAKVGSHDVFSLEYDHLQIIRT